MPDISMCESTLCSGRETCARNAASGTRPSEYRQAYGEFGDAPCKHKLPTFPGMGYAGQGRAHLAPVMGTDITPANALDLIEIHMGADTRTRRILSGPELEDFVLAAALAVAVKRYDTSLGDALITARQRR